MDISSLVGILADPKVLAFASPVIVGLMKKATDILPKWSLPILSILVGALASTLAGGDMATGAAAGLAGVGIREAVDQGKKAVAPPAA